MAERSSRACSSGGNTEYDNNVNGHPMCTEQRTPNEAETYMMSRPERSSYTSAARGLPSDNPLYGAAARAGTPHPSPYSSVFSLRSVRCLHRFSSSSTVNSRACRLTGDIEPEYIVFSDDSVDKFLAFAIQYQHLPLPGVSHSACLSLVRTPYFSQICAAKSLKDNYGEGISACFRGISDCMAYCSVGY